MGRLTNKVAIITGAARGIGHGIVDLFVQEGAHVIAGDVRPARARIVDAEWVELDVTDDQAWARVLGDVQRAHGRLDILVNNAGISEYETIEDTTMASWLRILGVNQTGVWLGMRAAVPAMRRAGGGSIVNISSILGSAAVPGEHAYHATKGAVLTMTKNAAVTYAPENIRANAILPGWIRTPMTEAQDVRLNNAFFAATPMLRGAEPSDVAQGALYLASDESRFVTGIDLPIDGGYLAQSAPLAGAGLELDGAR
jgi:NAD(P)-dependent dehydrogenase (short-subunit alcohol dehydrogenase family)